MGDQKRKSGIWHHRAPDYKLVYCGRPKENFPEKTTKLASRKEISLINDEQNSADRRTQQPKKIN